MKINHLWKICAIFLFVSFNSYGKNEKSTTINSSGIKFVKHHAKKPFNVPVHVTITPAANLHVVVVDITPTSPAGPPQGLNFTSSSTQNYVATTIGVGNIQVITQAQRCHVTINGTTIDSNPGAHYAANFSGVTLTEMYVSVVPF